MVDTQTYNPAPLPDPGYASSLLDKDFKMVNGFPLRPKSFSRF